MFVCNTREKTIPSTSTKIYKLGQYVLEITKYNDLKEFLDYVHSITPAHLSLFWNSKLVKEECRRQNLSIMQVLNQPNSEEAMEFCPSNKKF